MKQLGRVVLVAAVLFGTTTSPVANAEVAFIQPTINLSLPQINISSGINPLTGSYSNDALNILRAHQVALQQVQAAILYLQANRSNILLGKDSRYNQTFGDFYDPNSQFAGTYDRTLQIRTGKFDKFGNAITKTVVNTEHYDRVLGVYQSISNALRSAINYDLGAQLSLAADGTVVPDATFDTYRQGVVVHGDPQFGNGNFTLSAEYDNGYIQWGDSTSFTPRHLAQIAATPGSPLHWDDDNDISTTAAPLAAKDVMAFFHDRLDSYAVNSNGALTVYVGEAFLNEEQRSNSTPSGTPNQYFHPTELNQYQMIIAALAQSEGSSVVTIGADGSITFGVSIEAGLSAVVGASNLFTEALDANSYAAFANALTPTQDGGVGDGSLLPPPGKQATTSGVFEPFIPGS